MLGWAQVLSGGAAEATTTLAPIVVVGTTPLLGIGTPLSLVPANVQTIHGREIGRQHKNTLTEYFEKDVSSVDINEDEAQGSPYQTDIGYRGFAASPVLGTPQGLSGSNLDYYVNANAANDNGWADHNSSRVRQAFGRLRYTDTNTTLSLSAGGADNALQGTQTIPRSFLDNPKQAYTYPDLNRNSTGYVTASGFIKPYVCMVFSCTASFLRINHVIAWFFCINRGLVIKSLRSQGLRLKFPIAAIICADAPFL